MRMNTSSQIKVWDPVIRIEHWMLVLGFTIAYATGDDFLNIHVWAGYMVGVVVALRLIWGLIGTSHARFSDFIYRPLAIKTYLLDLILFRARRYIGHSPAGGAMVIALLLSLSFTVGTGLLTYAVRNHAGPLAGTSITLRLEPKPVAPEYQSIGITEEQDEHHDGAGHGLKNIHEFFASMTLVLIVLHLAGVGLASLVHRENLTRSMITGRKRPADKTDIGRQP